MPAPVTSRPVRNAPSTAASAPPPTTPPTPQPTHDQVREGAVSDVASIRQPRARRAMTAERAMARMATAFERGQDNGHALREVRRELAANPQILRALSGVPEDQMLETLRDEIGYLDGASLTVEIRDAISDRLVDSVRHDALRRVDGQIRQLQTARNGLAARMPTMDASEREQAQEVLELLDRGIEGFRGVKARFHGNAWEVSDFPRAAERAMTANGFARDGIASEVAAYEDPDVAIAHNVELGAELAVGAYEVAHAAHAGAAFVGAALVVAAVGIAAGYIIHKEAEKVRQFDIALGHQLGL